MSGVASCSAFSDECPANCKECRSDGCAALMKAAAFGGYTDEAAAMDMKPLSEHRWLHRLEGEWQFEGASLMGPGEDREVFSGYENVRRLGDFWIVAENEIVVDGETGRNIITLGFDAFRKQFVGTWVGSMMSALWTYRGSLDSTEKILMLETEGPSFEKEGHMAKYRDLLEMIDADTRRLQSFALSENGRWREFMNADYRRRRQ